MKEVTGILKASVPVIIGVAIGMLAYELIKKSTAKA